MYEYIDIVSFLNERIFNHEEYIASFLLDLYSEDDTMDNINIKHIEQFKNILIGGGKKIRKSYKKYISNNKYTQKKYTGGDITNHFFFTLFNEQKENNSEIFERYFKFIYNWHDREDIRFLIDE